MDNQVVKRQIDISPEAYAGELSALSDFWRNRSLVYAQQLADVNKALQEALGMVAELRERIVTLEDTPEGADAALAVLLRKFVTTSNLAGADELLNEARRIVAQGGE
ncbi:hypothetical protein ACLJYM_14410 [Rhizobium giardinii]|uniref:hypothetical protein n=1 Tax=Rhizobium giardinii TaxID=56731 RepID=UPI0039E14AB7